MVLTFLLVSAGAVWVWWDHGQDESPTVTGANRSISPLPSPQPAAEQVRKAEAAAVNWPPLDADAIAADAKSLVTRLFTASSAEERAECIHEAGKYTAEIEAMFAPSDAPKVELKMLARITSIPQHVPGGRPEIIFKLVTSKCTNGALVRLETGTDGTRRIYWPLLHESHEGTLARLLNSPNSEPAWVHVGLRPSHGLDIPAELRPKYITFDVQVSAVNDPHFVACVDRDTPLGRFLDRETEWGHSYLARLLVRKLDIQADAPCMIVIACEGAAENGEGR